MLPVFASPLLVQVADPEPVYPRRALAVLLPGLVVGIFSRTNRPPPR